MDEFELYYRQTETGAVFAAKSGWFVIGIVPISTQQILSERNVGYLTELAEMSAVKLENLK